MRNSSKRKPFTNNIPLYVFHLKLYFLHKREENYTTTVVTQVSSTLLKIYVQALLNFKGYALYINYKTVSKCLKKLISY